MTTARATTRSEAAARLLAVLEQELENTIIAPNTLLRRCEAYEGDAFSDGSRGDLVLVQGRGDRLHAVLACGPEELDDAALLDRFGACDANWCWLAVDRGNAARAASEASARRLGVITIDGTSLDRPHLAPPRPGIFIKAYRDLRKEWRTIDSW